MAGRVEQGGDLGRLREHFNMQSRQLVHHLPASDQGQQRSGPSPGALTHCVLRPSQPSELLRKPSQQSCNQAMLFVLGILFKSTNTFRRIGKK